MRISWKFVQFVLQYIQASRMEQYNAFLRDKLWKKQLTEKESNRFEGCDWHQIQYSCQIRQKWIWVNGNLYKICVALNCSADEVAEFTNYEHYWLCSTNNHWIHRVYAKILCGKSTDRTVLNAPYETKVKTASRKRIAAMKDITNRLSAGDRSQIFSYIGDYCPD